MIQFFFHYLSFDKPKVHAPEEALGMHCYMQKKGAIQLPGNAGVSCGLL